MEVKTLWNLLGVPLLIKSLPTIWRVLQEVLLFGRSQCYKQNWQPSLIDRWVTNILTYKVYLIAIHNMVLAHWFVHFVFFWVWIGGKDLLFICLFPLCSQGVLIKFPKDSKSCQCVPNSTILLLPHMLWPKLKVHICKL